MEPKEIVEKSGDLFEEAIIYNKTKTGIRMWFLRNEIKIYCTDDSKV